MIEADRQVALDGADLIDNVAPGVITGDERRQLRDLVHKRFDHRMAKLESGEKVWDITATNVLVFTGIK